MDIGSILGSLATLLTAVGGLAVYLKNHRDTQLATHESLIQRLNDEIKRLEAKVDEIQAENKEFKEDSKKWEAEARRLEREYESMEFAYNQQLNKNRELEERIVKLEADIETYERGK